MVWGVEVGWLSPGPRSGRRLPPPPSVGSFRDAWDLGPYLETFALPLHQKPERLGAAPFAENNANSPVPGAFHASSYRLLIAHPQRSNGNMATVEAGDSPGRFPEVPELVSGRSGMQVIQFRCTRWPPPPLLYLEGAVTPSLGCGCVWEGEELPRGGEAGGQEGAAGNAGRGARLLGTVLQQLRPCGGLRPGQGTEVAPP